jgi:F0F1-type ATP synthase assembly protein I
MATTSTTDEAAARTSAVRSDLASARTQFRSSMRGLDHSSIMVVELMAAFLTWGGIGWLVDAWLGTTPWALVVGALIGMAAGLYLIYLRAERMEGYDRLSRASTGGGADGR